MATTIISAPALMRAVLEYNNALNRPTNAIYNRSGSQLGGVSVTLLEIEPGDGTAQIKHNNGDLEHVAMHQLYLRGRA